MVHDSAYDSTYEMNKIAVNGQSTLALVNAQGKLQHVQSLSEEVGSV